MADTPDTDRLVVAWVRPCGYQRQIPVLARYYAEPWEQPGGDDEIGRGVEYDEESDTYSCPAGWYEERAEYGDDCAPCVRIPDDDVCGWCEVPRMESDDD